MADVLFARNTDPEGPQYVHVTHPIPGQDYYIRRGPYYVKHTYQPVTPVEGNVQLHTYTNDVSSEEFPEDASEITGVNPQEIENARGTHLLVTIVALVFPTLMFMIGFPVCLNKFKLIVHKLGSSESLTSKLKIYSVFGWITWFFHLGLLIGLCTFWIPTECYTDLEKHVHCGMSYKAVVVMVVLGFLTFIATVLTMSVGARFIQVLRQYSPSMLSNISTDFTETYGSV